MKSIPKPFLFLETIVRLFLILMEKTNYLTIQMTVIMSLKTLQKAQMSSIKMRKILRKKMTKILRS
jgi:hypothetical protein